MRVLAAIGAATFAYMTLIPASLVGSTIDPACSGPGCETSLLSDIVFVALYAACALSLAATALALARFVWQPTSDSERWIARLLPASAVALGVTFFALFSVANPIAGAVAVAIGGLCYSTIRRVRDSAVDPGRPQHGPPARLPPINGHAHPQKNGSVPHI